MTNTEHFAEDIEKLIPHRLPMRLVEEMIMVEDEAIETASEVRETWPTAEHGYVRSIVLIELIAQTAAVLQGWKERHEKKSAVGGLLVGVQHATPTLATVPVGSRLLCTVRISHGATNYLAFEGEVKDSRGMVLLTAAIQAFRPDSDLDAQPGEPT